VIEYAIFSPLASSTMGDATETTFGKKVA